MFGKLSKSLAFTAATIILFGSILVNGFAAANTVPESGAGEGSGTVSGYTISNISYTLAVDPRLLESVRFDVNPTAGAGPASTVRISVNNGTSWLACSDGGGGAWICAFPTGSEPNISGVNTLQVIAVD